MREITGEQDEETIYDFSKHELTDPKVQERAIFAGGCFWCMVEPFETKKESFLFYLATQAGRG